MIIGFLFLQIFCLAVGTHASDSEFFVSAPGGAQCWSNKTCHEFPFYANNSEHYFRNNSVFYFLEGTHELDRTLTVTAVYNLTLKGLGNKEHGFHERVMQSTVKIRCGRESQGGLVFLGVINLTLADLTISECSTIPLIQSDSRDLYYFYEYLIEIGSPIRTMGIFNVSLSLLQVSNVELLGVSIQNTTGFGLIGINAYNSTIYDSSFAVNNFQSAFECLMGRGAAGCRGGNMIFGYTYSWPNPCYGNDQTFTLDVMYSNFSFGYSFSFNTLFPGGGITVFMDQRDHYILEIYATTVQAYNNSAISGGNINFIATRESSYYTLKIENTLSSYGNYILQYYHELQNPSAIGGGLLIELGIKSKLINFNCQTTNTVEAATYLITVSSSLFTQNYAVLGGGVYISVEDPPVSLNTQNIILQSCDLNYNYGYIGIGLFFHETPFRTSNNQLEYYLFNVNISNSKISKPGYLVGNGSAAAINNLNNGVNVFNLLVIDNTPTQGLAVAATVMRVTGISNLFRNNSAQSGGALSLSQNSVVITIPPASIGFIDNMAKIDGGAIYINNGPSLYPYCFFQIQTDNETLQPAVKWYFENNRAEIAGDAIYGGDIENCSLLQLSNVAIQNSSTTIFSNIFHFSNQPGNTVVSSNPNKVCFCDNSSLNCALNQTHVEVFPGEYIELSVATLGVFESFSKGFIEVQEYIAFRKSVDYTLESIYPFIGGNSCINHRYKIYSTTNISYILLSLSILPPEVNVFESFVTFSVVNVTVGLLPCPPGFSLSNSAQECVCNEAMVQSISSNITCNIFNQHITRDGDVWIGYQNSSRCLQTENDCPFDYCISGTTSFSAYFPDSQCALERSGLLYGECASRLSLMFGSNKCGKCSNYYLLLILCFALAGISLVMVLLMLNLTVSVGTINGLLFFANVKINEPAFFTNGPVHFLSQFISWINLDFGIESCFYNGLNAISKFVVTVYFSSLCLVFDHTNNFFV